MNDQHPKIREEMRCPKKYIIFTLCLITVSLLITRLSFVSKIDDNVKKANVKGSCVIPKLTDFDQFYRFLEKPKASCKRMVQVGGIRFWKLYLDGDKWMCFDKGFKPNNCMVYSFGINNEWSWDDDMDLKRHCKVFSFDPTMGAQDHNRSSKITFFNLGLSNVKGLCQNKKQPCLVDTYRGIVKKLGHENTIIDYLKMDIEGSEIAVFKDILDNDLDLLDNIQQIGLEIHIGRADKHGFTVALQHWDIFHRLQCQGWRLLSNEINQVAANHFSYKGTLRSTCYELVWIKN